MGQKAGRRFFFFMSVAVGEHCTNCRRAWRRWPGAHVRLGQRKAGVAERAFGALHVCPTVDSACVRKGGAFLVDLYFCSALRAL